MFKQTQVTWTRAFRWFTCAVERWSYTWHGRRDKAGLFLGSHRNPNDLHSGSLGLLAIACGRGTLRSQGMYTVPAWKKMIMLKVWKCVVSTGRQDHLDPKWRRMRSRKCSWHRYSDHWHDDEMVGSQNQCTNVMRDYGSEWPLMIVVRVALISWRLVTPPSTASKSCNDRHPVVSSCLKPNSSRCCSRFLVVHPQHPQFRSLWTILDTIIQPRMSSAKTCWVCRCFNLIETILWEDMPSSSDAHPKHKYKCWTGEFPHVCWWNPQISVTYTL